MPRPSLNRAIAEQHLNRRLLWSPAFRPNGDIVNIGSSRWLFQFLAQALGNDLSLPPICDNL